jgi:uncharacterized protein with HEPN domain
MSAHDARITLRQIQEAAQRAREICAGRTMETLLADWQATAALERFVMIIGEAVKRLPSGLCARYPGVPWKEIAGTRDHLSHGYDVVDYQVLWDAVQTDVPVLLATVQRMLNDLGGDDDAGTRSPSGGGRQERRTESG